MNRLVLFLLVLVSVCNFPCGCIPTEFCVDESVPEKSCLMQHLYETIKRLLHLQGNETVAALHGNSSDQCDHGEHATTGANSTTRLPASTTEESLATSDTDDGKHDGDSTTGNNHNLVMDNASYGDSLKGYIAAHAHH